MSQSSGPIPASAPFDGSDANVILRSSDNIDFYVYKEILIVASSVFKDMFRMPQPPVMATKDVHPESGFPIIPLAEESRVLDSLLRICYPISNPVLSDVQNVGDVLKAAMKYDMQEAIAGRLKKTLESMIPTAPIEVYAMACILNLEEIRRQASRASCELSSFSYDPLLDLVSAGDFFRLLQERREAGQFGHGRHIFGKRRKGNSNNRSTSSATPDSDGSTLPPTPTSLNLGLNLDRFGPATDITLRTSDGKEFQAHECILAISSSVIRDILVSTPYGPPGTELPVPQQRRRLSLPESASTVEALLRCCYPSESVPLVSGVQDAGSFLVAAKKYKITRAISVAQDTWIRCIAAEPLRGYFTAKKNGWEAEAVDATRLLVFEGQDEYISEMETVSARAYHQLLELKQHLRHRLHRQVGDWSSLSYRPERLPSELGDYLTALDDAQRPFTFIHVHRGDPDDDYDVPQLKYTIERGRNLLQRLENLPFI